MESAWSNGKPAYRCRHGHTTASTPDPGRPKNAYIREDRILPHLPALHLLLTGAGPGGERRRQRTRRGADVRRQASAETGQAAGVRSPPIRCPGARHGPAAGPHHHRSHAPAAVLSPAQSR
jgi:hypothetical protein